MTQVDFQNTVKNIETPDGSIMKIQDSAGETIWRRPMTMNPVVDPAGCGSVNYDGTDMRYEDVVQFTAEPAQGCTFKNWSGGSVENPISLSITADNMPLTAFFEVPDNVINVKVVNFGCSPNLSVQVKDRDVEVKPTERGENDFEISAPPDTQVRIQVESIKNVIYYAWKDDVQSESGRDLSFNSGQLGQPPSIKIMCIAKEHQFAAVEDQIHTDRFIYSPGCVFPAGHKYKFHWQSDYSKASKPGEGTGRIYIGHQGYDSSHTMHLSFGYKVNGGDPQKIEVEYSVKGGSWKIGDTINVTGLSRQCTNVVVKDYVFDATGYDQFDTLEFGIILRDNDDYCGGIWFGYVTPKNPQTTTCTIEITTPQ